MFLLQLRKILLHNKLYIILFIIVLLISLIRLNIKKESIYTNNTNKVTGTIFKIIKVNSNRKILLNGKEKIIVNDYTKNKMDLKLGDKIEVIGTFKKPEESREDYLFDYKKYLERNNIYYIVNTKKIIIIKKNSNIYYYLKQIIINHLGNNPYLNTFLVGDKSLINRESIRSYQENGISHLFAISGMHITLLSTIITKLLRKYLSEETAFKITSVILLFYLLLIGLSPSVLRGVLFFILFGINRIYYFYVKPRNILLIVISISLLINPKYIYDVGFQYSYLISFSLICLNNELKSSNYFISLFKVSWLSFFVSIPITLYNFYQLNIMSIIYNLFFVPLVSLIIFPLGIICFFIRPFDFLFDDLTRIMEEISIYISKIDVGKVVFIKLPTFIYIIYFIIVILFILTRKKIYTFILISMLLIHFFIPYINKTDFIYIIDVGQGDSTILHINNKNILIDTGGNRKKEIFYNISKPTLKTKGIKKVDTLIITHGDYDHMGEAINLVENFKVEKVIFNCGEFNDLEKDLINVLDKKKIPYYSCIKELNIDNNKLYFLQTKEYDNENDNSNVIYTELDGYKFMFMGDAGIDKEKDILNKYNISNIDVLKVGHHGSKTSSGKEFIVEMNPKYSIISVGKNNRYGHPNKEVLNNLEYSKIYRTDQDGSIMFKIKNNKLEIETCSP